MITIVKVDHIFDQKIALTNEYGKNARPAQLELHKDRQHGH